MRSNVVISGSKATRELSPLASVAECTRFISKLTLEDLFGEPPLQNCWYKIFAKGTPEGTAREMLKLPIVDHAQKLTDLKAKRVELSEQFLAGRPAGMDRREWKNLGVRRDTAKERHEQFVVFSYNFLRLETNQRAAFRQVFLKER